MELLFRKKTIPVEPGNRNAHLPEYSAQNCHQGAGERGEVVLTLSLLLSSGSLLLLAMFWLNSHYEKKTKDHLNEFRKDWNALHRKYQT